MGRPLALPDEFTDATTRWWGRGARFASLSGSVSRDDFLRVYGGHLRNPETGEREQIPLAQSRRSGHAPRLVHRPGWDFTFGAPKSTSLAFLVGCDRAVLAAHQRAVLAALGFAEAHLATGRRTLDGRGLRVQMGNLLVAIFWHSTNRAAEPHLHAHCLVANAVYDESYAMWRAVEPSALIRYQSVLGMTYRHALFDGLRDAGYGLEDTANGYEIAGIDRRARWLFSQRTEAIREHQRLRARQKGWDPDRLTFRQRKMSTLATREEKVHIPLPVLRAQWTELAAIKRVPVDAVVRAAIARRIERQAAAA